MSHTDDPFNATTLPALETILSRAAQRRATHHHFNHRWMAGIAVCGAALAGGGAAAATGVLHIANGQTPAGRPYTIDRATAPTLSNATVSPGPSGQICLQLRYGNGGAARGCGETPTAAKPFGVVVVDTNDASGDRIIYGLVTSDIARVSVLGTGNNHTDASTEHNPQLPGRFFSAIVPNHGRIELVGYDPDGHQVARTGNRAQPTHSARSREEAAQQGDPAGYAPSVDMPSTFTYKGQSITQAQAIQQGLTCEQSRDGVQCHDPRAGVLPLHVTNP
ncbi:MAG TPA: hypothetical protein VHZ75_10155 [Solirubrobacteraceae bacterium]|nr:hypothetical protein [Solirubrobacteraceae bacterium]